MIVGVDASNIIAAGGVTHLVELLAAADLAETEIERVVVWAPQRTLSSLPERPWLSKRVVPRKGVVGRAYWTLRGLDAALRHERCGVVFVPGGTYLGRFRPFVTMSRNMLPFDLGERSRYPIGRMRLRLSLLKIVQKWTFLRADGLIFLTEWARSRVVEAIGTPRGRIAVIPHGVSSDFRAKPRAARDVDEIPGADAFRITYVSPLTYYKHQDRVIEAVSKVRKSTGWPLRLELIGAGTMSSYVDNVARVQRSHDPDAEWCAVRGHLDYGDLPGILRCADIAIFTSSCENMPNTLIEKMAAGLPVVCSNRGPMPECLGGGGVQVDPENVDEIAQALEMLIRDRSTRACVAELGFQRALEFRWERCAEETFKFVESIARCTSASRL